MTFLLPPLAVVGKSRMRKYYCKTIESFSQKYCVFFSEVVFCNGVPDGASAFCDEVRNRNFATCKISEMDEKQSINSCKYHR